MTEGLPTDDAEPDDLKDESTAVRMKQIDAAANYSARWVTRVAPDAGEDADDVRQSLRLKALALEEKYDPDRASFSTFIAPYIRGGAYELVRQRLRHRKHSAVLEQEMLEDTPGSRASLGEPVDGGIDRDGEYSAVEHAIDIRRVIEAMPAELRQMCQLLQIESATDVQRRCGLSPAEFYRRRDEIGMRFRSFGLSR